MRRVFLGCALLALSAVPFQLSGVKAGASSDDAPSIVRTVARGVTASGLATDSTGRVYFTADDRVFRISAGLQIAPNGRAVSNSALELIAGNGQRGSLGDGGPATLAQLDLFPIGPSNSASANGNLAADSAGNLFLADTLNDTVRRVDNESQLISSIAGRWATGTSSATSERISQPKLVALDAVGNAYIAGNNQLSRLDSSGALSQIATIVNPVALAVSRDGNSVIVSIRAGRMLVLFQRSDANHFRTAFTWPANQAPNSGAGSSTDPAAFQTYGNAEHGFSSENFSGLAFDSAGNIYAAKGHANVVERFNPETSSRDTIAGSGRAGYIGDGGPPLSAEFKSPGALAIDDDGNLFIADVGNLAIREVTHAAAAAGVTLAPNTFTFSNEPTGGSSAPETFTLTNNLSSEVTDIAIDFTGGSTPPDFTQTSTCANTLDAGSSCTINVVFSPQSAGTRSAALHVTDSDSSSPQTAALSGFADDYELALQSGNTDTLTIVQGGTANYNLAVVPDNTFSGTVTIQCPVGLPLDVSCGLASGTAPSSSRGASGASGTTTLPLEVSAGTPQVFTIALSTMAKNQALNAPPVAPRPSFPAPALGTFVLGAMAITFASGKIRRRSGTNPARIGPIAYLAVRNVGFGLAIATIILAAIACGGSGTPTLTQKPNPGTPVGTYHFNVIGSSQGASRAFTITLIVQSP